MLATRADWWDGEGPIPDRVIDRMARELEIGRWMMRFALYGDEAVVDHRFAKIKAAFERRSRAPRCGARKRAPEEIPSLEHPAERIQGGVPSLDWNAMTGVVRRRGGRPHRLLAGRAADRPRRAGGARPAARDGRGAGLDYIAGAAARSTRAASSTSRW